MSGICGIVLNARDRGVGQNHLLQMVRMFNPPEEHGSAVTIGPVGIGGKKFGCCSAGVEGITVNGFSLIAGFYGVIIHRDDLPEGPIRDSSDLQFLVQNYLQHGLAMLKNLRGEFVLAIWDGREETFYLVTDRFRVHQMFYYQDRDKFVFSSNLKGLLSCPLPIGRTINEESVVNVVRIFHYSVAEFDIQGDQKSTSRACADFKKQRNKSKTVLGDQFQPTE